VKARTEAREAGSRVWMWRLGWAEIVEPRTARTAC